MSYRSPSSLKRLFLELFWPLDTLSWRPVQARDGMTEVTFSVRLRADRRPFAVRWLILSACFLVAAGVASTVLLSLAGISAFVGLTILFVDRRTRTPLPEAGGAVVQEPEASSKRQPS